MNYLTPFFEQSNWAWDVLPLFLSLLSLIWFWLWPSAIFAYFFSSFHPMLVLLLILLNGMLVLRRNEVEMTYPFSSRVWVQMLILMGLALSWPQSSEYPWPDFALAGLPFVLILPLCKWLKSNTGGALFLTPALVLGWLSIFDAGPKVSENSQVLACMLIYLMLLMAWYRQIPAVIKFLLLLCAMVAPFWVLGGQVELMVVMLGFLLHKLFSKWLWGKSFCQLQLGVWSQAGLIILALSLSGGSDVNVLHLCFSCALLFMATQESCRLCIAQAKCREVVLSWWMTHLPLLYLLLIISGLTPGYEIYLILCFTALSQEVTRSFGLKPIKIEDLSENPCKEDFKVSLN